MKVVILAGGFGTRLSEETDRVPKPLVAIGDKPIIWHIMKIYSQYGFNDFVICLGYKGYSIKEYFANYLLHVSDVTIDFEKNATEIHDNRAEKWRVTMIDTGQNTLTGGRIKRVQHVIGNEPFMLTYGDGVGNVDIRALVDFHKSEKNLATVTAVEPSGRFGILDIEENGRVDHFQEKPKGEGGWINGGFFVLEPEVFDYIEGDQSIWEREPLEKLAADKQLRAFKHHGFWRPMDTLRDKRELESLWHAGDAPWKIW